MNRIKSAMLTYIALVGYTSQLAKVSMKLIDFIEQPASAKETDDYALNILNLGIQSRIRYLELLNPNCIESLLLSKLLTEKHDFDSLLNKIKETLDVASKY